MKSQYEQLLLRRRAKSGASEMADNSDGLLDLLCNVVGVLVLVSSLAGVFAATSAVNIQAPMRTETKSSSGFFRQRMKEFGIYNQLLTVWPFLIENEWKR